MVLKRERFNLERVGGKNVGAKEWFALITAILIVTDLIILLNIPILRQIFGFIFLTILPGLLILQILKLNKLDFLEKFILAWGISISFLMFFGLLLNNSLLSLGYETPLSTISLLIAFNIAFVVLAISGYKINKELIFILPNFNLTTSEKIFLIAPILFPALSIFGMHVMNTTDNNVILMFLLFLIPIYVVFVCFFNHKFPKKLYPIVIFLISISLLLLLSLRSNHLIGCDVHAEYYFFRTTLDNLHWSILKPSTLDACLAISLLPTIYQSILNTPPEFLYKILLSLIYSVSPLAIYVISKKYVEESYAFLASCFFMFQAIFLWTESNARSNIATLFFAFAMMTLFSDKIEPLKKKILFIVFMASCMVSHYSTTYIFFFVILGAFVGIEVLSKKYTFKKVISLTIILLFSSMIFLWYSQVTEMAFNQGVWFIDKTISSLNDLFLLESRGDRAQTLVGKGVVEKGIPHMIEFVFTWLTFGLIGIGVITLIRRYKEMSFPELKLKKPDFLKEKFEVGYFVITLACAGLLVATVALPHITAHYDIHRQYPLALIFLSLFFVIGGVMLSKNLSLNLLRKVLSKTLRGKKAIPKKQKAEGVVVMSKRGKNTSQVLAYLVILIVLIPYFFCVTDVTYQIFGYPHELILSSEGEWYDNLYIHDHWLIAGEWSSSSEVVGSRLVNKQKTIYNVTEYLGMFDEKNRIYDNGGSEVWK